MRVCSFVPAATDIIYRLGLEDLLFGVTFECKSDKPKVVRSALEGRRLSSREIDQAVAQARREANSLYSIDTRLLREANPDLIFVQDVCDVCQIGSEQVSRALGETRIAPRLIHLNPHTLEDVLDNITTIARALGAEERGHQLVRSLHERIHHVQHLCSTHGAPARRVAVIEWIDPIYTSGQWVPEQVALAGGIDLLSGGIERSTAVSWKKLRLIDPDILVVAPCGLDMESTKTEAARLRSLPGWETLSAVRNSTVFLADAALFTQPAATLIDGIELLASLFHPSLFDLPGHLTGSVASLPRLKTCPRCGTEFRCGPDHPRGHCWCSELPNVLPLLPGASCFCPHCLEKEIQERLSGSDAGHPLAPE